MVAEAVSSKSGQSCLATVVNYLLVQFNKSLGKTALLCGLGVVLVVLIIRATVKPDSASAKVVELAVPQKPTVIFQSPAEPASKLPLSSVGSAESNHATEPKQIQDTIPRRDIFAVDLSYFTQLSSEQPQSSGPAGPLDQKKRRLIALKAKVRQFQLQSTMTGQAPAAYIDGILLREGQRHKGFRITKINNRSVLLEQNGHVFDLHMPQR